MPRFLRFLCILAALAIIGVGLFTSEELSDARWLGLLAIAWILLLFGTRMPIGPDVPTFNRAVLRTAMTLASMFAIISAQLVRIQVVQSDATYNKTAKDPTGETISNPRKTSAELSAPRGKIYDRNGTLVADTVKDGNAYLRDYPNPVTGYVAGYFSPLLYGSSGLESSRNDALSGKESIDPVERTINALLGRQQQGLDLHLTLDTNLQQTATDLLQGRKGAVVVLEVATGAVLVLASTPNYDPDRLVTSPSGDSSAAESYWAELSDDPDAPFVLRANLGLYTPGSTFKTITAAAAIDSGLDTPTSVYTDNGELEIDGRTLVENNRPDETRSEWTLEEGIEWSLNVVFAQVGMHVGADRLWDYAKRFGFGEEIPFDLPVSESQLASDRDFLGSNNALADTAFGQGEIQVSPLHMAMIAATFANGGKMMRPYLVASEQDGDGNVRNRASAEVWKTPISSATAESVRSMMVSAVNEGSIQAAITPGYTVGGKTGTAERGDGSVHSWLMAFIGDDTPRYAAAVVLEEGSDSLGTSVAVCQAILEATITSLG